MKIEIGSQKPRDGWMILDHKEDGSPFDIMFDRLDQLGIKDGSVEYFYMSHVIEHIPVPFLVDILKHLRDKLQPNGKLRLVCPDLEATARAYVNKNENYFNSTCVAVKPPYKSLGLGGHLLNTIVSHGSDMYLYDRTCKKQIIGMGHIAAYDYEMLSKMLMSAGFFTIENSGFDSSIDTHKQVGQLFVNAFKG